MYECQRSFDTKKTFKPAANRFLGAANLKLEVNLPWVANKFYKCIVMGGFLGKWSIISVHYKLFWMAAISLNLDEKTAGRARFL